MTSEGWNINQAYAIARQYCDTRRVVDLSEIYKITEMNEQTFNAAERKIEAAYNAYQDWQYARKNGRKNASAFGAFDWTLSD